MDAERPDDQACTVLRPADPYVGRQAITYAVGISAQSVGAKALHMQLAKIPPGARAKAHRHEDHETALFAISGVSGIWHGPNLEHHDIVRPGEFLYIPRGVPHLPYNPSDTEEAVAIIARTDPNEQESVVLMPELEARIPPA